MLGGINNELFFKSFSGFIVVGSFIVETFFSGALLSYLKRFIQRSSSQPQLIGLQSDLCVGGGSVELCLHLLQHELHLLDLLVLLLQQHLGRLVLLLVLLQPVPLARRHGCQMRKLSRATPALLMFCQIRQAFHPVGEKYDKPVLFIVCLSMHI